MSRHHSENNGAFDDAVQTAALLKPRIEASVRRLSADQRADLRRSLLTAEKELADGKTSIVDRLRRVQEEFASHAALGGTWALIAGKISDYRSGSAPGQHELGSVSLMLGMILDAVGSQDQKTRAA